MKNFNSENFYKNEISFRKHSKLPPFYKFISIIVSGKNSFHVEKYAVKLIPATATIERKNNRFLFQKAIIENNKNPGPKKLNYNSDKLKTVCKLKSSNNFKKCINDIFDLN